MAELHWNESAAPRVTELEDGTQVYRTSAWAPPGCHGVGCGLRVFMKDGKFQKVEGDPDSPITHGKLCPRCLALKDYVDHPDRLRYPMKRSREDRGLDKWERITWDEAYDLIEENYNYCVDQWGIDTCCVFAGTGREGGRYHFTMALDVFNTIHTVESISGWSCIIPRMAGMAWVIGAPYLEVDNSIGLPGRYDNPKWECPKYILNWGRDPLRSNPDGFWGHSIIDMMKRGAKLINVDPRVNWLSTRSEIYLQPRPGTDGALAIGILNEVIQSGKCDYEFIDKWCYGFDELKERAAEYPAEKVAQICDVDAEDIRAVAKCLAQKPCALSMGLAVDQNPNSIQIAHALLSIFAVMGNIDIPGGIFLGQPLKMFAALQADQNGAEEAAASSEEVKEPVEPAYSGDPACKVGIGHDDYPGLPKVANTPHPDVVLDCLENKKPYRLEFAYLMNTNILACMPAQPQRWFEAMRDMHFIACSDLFMTPTIMGLADLVLPVCTSLEREGIVTNNMASMAGQIGAMTAPLPREGETKSDLEIALDLFNRLHPESTDQKWKSVHDYLDADLAPVDGCDFDYEQLKEIVMCQYELDYRKYETGDLRADGQIGFSTPTGRIELWSTVLDSIGVDPLPYYIEPPLGPVARPDIARNYPLTLITGARQFTSFHSEHRQIAKLRQFHPWPEVQINPKTAEEIGIAEGSWVYVENEWGKVKVKATLTPTVKESVVSCDHGWWYPERNAEDMFDIWETSTNQLMPHKVVGPTGFGAPYKCLPCKIVLAD